MVTTPHHANRHRSLDAARTRFARGRYCAMKTKGGNRGPADAGGAAERIRGAAIRLFRQRGYHGTSMRDLADAVQLESASLYYHYPSKHDILFELFRRTMDDLSGGLREAIGNGGNAQQQLCAVVRFHVGFHISRQDEAFVSHSELRVLNLAQRAAIIEMRDRYQELVCALLRDGVAQGLFDVSDVRMTATAILMMCSGVSDWFGAHGRLSGEQIADRYVDLVLRMVVAPQQCGTTP